MAKNNPQHTEIKVTDKRFTSSKNAWVEKRRKTNWLVVSRENESGKDNSEQLMFDSSRGSLLIHRQFFLYHPSHVIYDGKGNTLLNNKNVKAKFHKALADGQNVVIHDRSEILPDREVKYYGKTITLAENFPPEQLTAIYNYYDQVLTGSDVFAFIHSSLAQDTTLLKPLFTSNLTIDDNGLVTITSKVYKIPIINTTTGEMIELPGDVTVVYHLTPSGFQLQSLYPSNAILSRLCFGDHEISFDWIKEEIPFLPFWEHPLTFHKQSVDSYHEFFAKLPEAVNSEEKNVLRNGEEEGIAIEVEESEKISEKQANQKFHPDQLNKIKKHYSKVVEDDYLKRLVAHSLIEGTYLADYKINNDISLDENGMVVLTSTISQLKISSNDESTLVELPGSITVTYHLTQGAGFQVKPKTITASNQLIDRCCSGGYDADFLPYAELLSNPNVRNVFEEPINKTRNVDSIIRSLPFLAHSLSGKLNFNGRRVYYPSTPSNADPHQPDVNSAQDDHVPTFSNEEKLFKAVVKAEKRKAEEKHISEDISVYDGASLDGKVQTRIDNFTEAEKFPEKQLHLIKEYYGDLVVEDYLRTLVKNSLAKGLHMTKCKIENNVSYDEKGNIVLTSTLYDLNISIDDQPNSIKVPGEITATYHIMPEGFQLDPHLNYTNKLIEQCCHADPDGDVLLLAKLLPQEQINQLFPDDVDINFKSVMKSLPLLVHVSNDELTISKYSKPYLIDFFNNQAEIEKREKELFNDLEEKSNFTPEQLSAIKAHYGKVILEDDLKKLVESSLIKGAHLTNCKITNDISLELVDGNERVVLTSRLSDLTVSADDNNASIKIPGEIEVKYALSKTQGFWLQSQTIKPSNELLKQCCRGDHTADVLQFAELFSSGEVVTLFKQPHNDVDQKILCDYLAYVMDVRQAVMPSINARIKELESRVASYGTNNEIDNSEKDKDEVIEPENDVNVHSAEANTQAKLDNGEEPVQGKKEKTSKQIDQAKLDAVRRVKADLNNFAFIKCKEGTLMQRISDINVKGDPSARAHALKKSFRDQVVNSIQSNMIDDLDAQEESNKSKFILGARKLLNILMTIALVPKAISKLRHPHREFFSFKTTTTTVDTGNSLRNVLNKPKLDPDKQMPITKAPSNSRG